MEAAGEPRSADEVFDLLDVKPYFELTGTPTPESKVNVLEKLRQAALVKPHLPGDAWNITNLGAIVLARRLSSFGYSMARKGARFVAYRGLGRASQVIHRFDAESGYAIALPMLLEFIQGILPKNEHVGVALRRESALYPPIAIRELVANALIHQDMTVTGAGPQVELFDDRLEITSPGRPLVSPDRFIDAAPISRNEALASLMRRMKMCEEQGTGIDTVISAVELFQLPPPDFRIEDHATRTVLFSPRDFARMTPEERVRACYQHAALKHLSGGIMKNSTFRERLGIEGRNASMVSKIIAQALRAGLIRTHDPAHPKAGYLPAWAS